MSLSPLYLFFPAWLLGIAQVNGCFEVGVGAGAYGSEVKEQTDCALQCAETRDCLEWTYNIGTNYCWLKSNLDKKMWVTGTKTCVGNIPYCINIVVILSPFGFFFHRDFFYF